ncbi:MAG: hypothetical protein LV479_07845 [Methylacidiphilales bacterium]|nr:hypothetical protein [Candidatus Methylacidiphilales bacterium]
MKKASLCFLVLILAACSNGDDSIESKTEWGNLQSINQNYGGKPISNPEIVSKDGTAYFCVVSSDSLKQRIWILLNPSSSPYYKQMPEGDYSINKDDYQKVKSSGLASSTVLEVLSSHVK